MSEYHGKLSNFCGRGAEKSHSAEVDRSKESFKFNIRRKISRRLEYIVGLNNTYLFIVANCFGKVGSELISRVTQKFHRRDVAECTPRPLAALYTPH